MEQIELLDNLCRQGGNLDSLRTALIELLLFLQPRDLVLRRVIEQKIWECSDLTSLCALAQIIVYIPLAVPDQFDISGRIRDWETYRKRFPMPAEEANRLQQLLIGIAAALEATEPNDQHFQELISKVRAANAYNAAAALSSLFEWLRDCPCANERSLAGSELKGEIYVEKDSEGLCYCFSRADLLGLAGKGYTNPYTGRPLNREAARSFLQRYGPRLAKRHEEDEEMEDESEGLSEESRLGWKRTAPEEEEELDLERSFKKMGTKQKFHPGDVTDDFKEEGWVQEYLIDNPTARFDIAAEKNDLVLLQILAQDMPELFQRYHMHIISTALFHSRYPIIQWLYDQFPQDVANERTVNFIALSEVLSDDSLLILRFIWDRMSEAQRRTMAERPWLTLARNGNISGLTTFATTPRGLADPDLYYGYQQPESYRRGIIWAAASSDHLDVIQWARAQNPPFGWTEHAVEAAGRAGAVKSLEWMMQHQCPWSSRMFVRAHRKTQRWLSRFPEYEAWLEEHAAGVGGGYEGDKEGGDKEGGDDDWDDDYDGEWDGDWSENSEDSEDEM